MCLHIKQTFKNKKEAINFSKKPLIAKEDIRVYKALAFTILLNQRVSPIKRFPFNKGFHYTNGKFSFDFFRGYGFTSLSILRGFHSNKTRKSAEEWETGLVITMYI